MRFRVKFEIFLRGIAFAVTASFAATGATAQQAATIGQTVITAAHMLDVASGKTVDHSAIFVGSDGRTTNIADARTVRWGADVRHIDLGERTLLPGLIDMHVHLTSLAEVGGYPALRYTDSFWTVVGIANAKTTLDAGFTTVRNVGSADFEDVGLKQAIEGGYIPGPRIIPAGWAIGATGGHYDSGGLPPSMDRKEPSVVDSPEEARRKVRWLHKYGARVIKICATGSVFSLGDSVGGQQLSLDEMKAIAVGRYADIIAVDGDALADVTRLEHVAAVMKAGVLVKGE